MFDRIIIKESIIWLIFSFLLVTTLVLSSCGPAAEGKKNPVFAYKTFGDGTYRRRYRLVLFSHQGKYAIEL